MKVPFASFTLLFSELTTEPWGLLAVADSFRFEIPTTPWVLAVIGGFALVLLGAALGHWPAVGGEFGVPDGVPAPIPGERSLVLPGAAPPLLGMADGGGALPPVLSPLPALLGFKAGVPITA
jgi:hypothetical protein